MKLCIVRKENKSKSAIYKKKCTGSLVWCGVGGVLVV